MKTKYITKRGKIFLTNPGYQFVIEPKERHYELRGKYFKILYPSRHEFDIALEMGGFSEYTVELFAGVWH